MEYPDLLNLSDDEDYNELVNLQVYPRRPQNFRRRTNHFTEWNDQEFLNRFRLSKNTVNMLVVEVSADIESVTNRNHALSPEEMVLVTLRFLATGCILQVVGDFCGIDKSTCSRTITKTLQAVARLKSNFIYMPVDEELNAVRQGLYNISRFPRCIGDIDCTHIKIQSPGGPDAEIYRNRKGFFSLNIQAICDADLLIRNIVCRWPGSAADATIFNNSRIRQEFEFGRFGDNVLLGDSGYPIRPYLMTPVPQPQTVAQQLYNEAQIRTRNPIERCFGVLKRRFPILSLGIKVHVSKVEKIVVTTAILHNIATSMRDALPAVNEEVEAAIEALNINLENVNNANEPVVAANEIVRYALITQYFGNLV